jgi:FkbM family methyltransferase
MGRRGVFGRAAQQLRATVADARLVGIGSLKLRLCRLLKRPDCMVTFAGAGPVAVRPSQPDLASLHQMLRKQELAIRIPAIAAAIAGRCDAIRAKGGVPVIVDAGAYIGASAIWFARTYPAAHVVALEPDPESFGLLERNVRSLGNVTAIQAAVAARPGHVQMVPMAQSWANRVERSRSGVKAMTMDQAVASVPGGQPFIAKVNIEGFESELFSENLDWLDRIVALFIEPHDCLLPGQHSSRAFQKALGARDFHLLILGETLCYVRL